MHIYLFWKNKVHLYENEFLNFCFLAKKISKNDLKWLRNTKRLQKLIYSIFVFLSSYFHNFYVFYFWNYFWTNQLWYYGILTMEKHRRFLHRASEFHCFQSFQCFQNLKLGSHWRRCDSIWQETCSLLNLVLIEIQFFIYWVIFKFSCSTLEVPLWELLHIADIRSRYTIYMYLLLDW